MFKLKRHQQGSALLAAVILLGIAGLIMAGSASVIQPMQRYFGQRNKGTDMRSLSEEGLQLAIRDLLERAKQNDWTTLRINGQSTDLQTLANVGLVVALESPIRNKVLPRFSRQKQDGSSMEIYYIPSIENADPKGETDDYDSLYPKLFNVVVESKKAGSAQIESMEAMVAVKLMTPGDYALSFVENYYGGSLYTADDYALNPVPYSFIPIVAEGDVHLGKIHKDNFYFDASFYHPSHDVPANEYVFNGKTTINSTTGDLTSNTFNRSSNASFTMNDFEDEFDLQYMDDSTSEIDEWKGQLFDTADYSFVSTHVCFKFVDNVLERWDCVTGNMRPDQRYSGEFQGGAPTSTYQIPAAGLNIYVKGQVHVKGKLNGKVAIFADDYAWIEGDIQYADQSTQSDDLFSLFSLAGVRIPSTIPNHLVRYFDVASGSTLTNSTNVTVSNDRDTDNARYYNPNGAGGGTNAYGSLDLDGCFMSFGDLEIMPFSFGRDKILGNNYTIWDQYNSSASDYYYYYDSGAGAWVHQANPAVCAVNNTNPNSCPDGQELQHNYSDAIWVYGCMSFEKPSPFMHRDGLGFQRMVLKSDDRFKSYIPYGMPSLKYPKVDLVWSRRLNKESDILQAARDEVDAAGSGGQPGESR
ncbi:MAG TPA: hypothetical protein PKC21_10715 [Oligoflexia bacterium]|nr:hypothetical protein [Oligoflexia bacterium]HMR25808.1 hypothetical protein [Oligoflexia bacterium]